MLRFRCVLVSICLCAVFVLSSRLAMADAVLTVDDREYNIYIELVELFDTFEGGPQTVAPPFGQLFGQGSGIGGSTQTGAAQGEVGADQAGGADTAQADGESSVEG